MEQRSLFPSGRRSRGGAQRTVKGTATAAVQASTPPFRSASSGTKRTAGWWAPTLGPNDSTLSSLSLLRDRSRAAVRNDGYAAGIIEHLVSNIVGTGLKPQCLAEDRDFRKKLQALWTLWTDTSDADGTLDWYGQQSQAVRCWLEAGEVFIRRRERRPEDGLVVPLQLQVLEPEMCPHDYSGINPKTGNRIRAGIEFDRLGRRAAYYFYASRPGDMQDWNAGDLRRIPAESVLHLFKPRRPGQMRGIPHLTPALLRLRELEQFDDAVLVRHKLANLFVAFLKPAAAESSNIMPLTGEAPGPTENGRPTLGLQPGIFQELAPGEEVQFSEPPDTITGFADFIKHHLRAVGAATGVPYEVLTGDMDGMSDRLVRVILAEFRRRIQAEQHQSVAFQVCRPVWLWWMDLVFLSGALPIPADYLADSQPYAKVKWMPQGWPYLQPVQDIEADEKAIRAGLTSRSAIVSENGDDAEVIDQEQADDNARADELGLKYDSDGRQAKASSGTGAPPAASKQNDAQDPADPNASEYADDEDPAAPAPGGSE